MARSCIIILTMLLVLGCGGETITPTVFPPTVVITGNTYHVSISGNDAGAGTSSVPFKTVQKCLNVVVVGDTCLIAAGTYNEALTLKTSGTVSLPITIKCEANKECTINSGIHKTLISGGRVDYYTIDGLRLIASFTPSDQSDVSIDLGENIPFSRTDKTSGNHGFVVKNCYIEGAIHFYGHNNLVENCELNGKNIYHNALMDNYSTSHDNIYRNNTIYDFLLRGIWSMESTDNILIEGNTIRDIQFGIDCDGAAVPVTRCRVVNNHVYNVGASQWGAGIFLENCFDCLIQGNTVHDIQNGAGIFDINYGNGSSTGWHTFNNVEYRGFDSNTVVTHNVIYNYLKNAGIYVVSVSGLDIDHNTFYNVGAPPSIEFREEKDDMGVGYPPKDETITNNIFFSKGVVWFNTTTSGLVSSGNFVGDPSFINPMADDFHLQSNSPACISGVDGSYSGAFPCH